MCTVKKENEDCFYCLCPIADCSAIQRKPCLKLNITMWWLPPQVFMLTSNKDTTFSYPSFVFVDSMFGLAWHSLHHSLVLLKLFVNRKDKHWLLKWYNEGIFWTCELINVELSQVMLCMCNTKRNTLFFPLGEKLKLYFMSFIKTTNIIAREQTIW